jgi:hypothetical protein
MLSGYAIDAKELDLLTKDDVRGVSQERARALTDITLE